MTTQDNQTSPNITKWMPLWIGDLRREATGQPPEFIGMYINLMMAAWENGGQLPNSEAHLARASGGSNQQWLDNRQALANLFVPFDGAWSHNLLRSELTKAAAISQRRKQASKKGNDQRWGIARSNAKEATDALLALISKDGGAY